MTKHMTGTREEWLAARLKLLEAEKEASSISWIHTLGRSSRRMSAFGTKRPWIRRQSMSALPRFSDIDLFGYFKRIVHLDP